MFLRSSDGNYNRDARALLIRLDRKRRDRWPEAVQSIDFLHSSRKAWSMLNNLTRRTRHSSRHCLVSADAIAYQLVRNGRYEDVNRESSRLLSQEISDLWKATIPSLVIIPGNYTSREFTVALQRLKPGKTCGLYSICSKLILHAGAHLKSWLCGFLSSCLR